MGLTVSPIVLFDYHHNTLWLEETKKLKKTYLSDEHLKDQHPQAPPIDCARIRRFGEHFGRQKFGGAAKRAGPVAETHALFAQTEIGNFHVTLRVQQQIVQLEIPVDDFVLVQVLQPQHYAGGVENCALLAEHVGVDVHHQITAGRVLHYKTDVRLGLETREQVDEERMSDTVGD